MSASPMELLKKWLGHPEDIYNLLRFKMGGYRAVMPRIDPVSGTGCASVLSFGAPAGDAVEWGPGGGGRGGGGCHLPAALPWAERCTAGVRSTGWALPVSVLRYTGF